jgi:hypothetical protein
LAVPSDWIGAKNDISRSIAADAVFMNPKHLTSTTIERRNQSITQLK